MKKILLTLFGLLIIPAIFGMKHRELSDREIDRMIDYAIIGTLKEAGYTVLPEVVVTAYRNEQDTVKKAKKYQREYDDLYFTKKDAKMEKEMAKKNSHDTINKSYNNNYYDDNDFEYANRINKFHHDGFNFWFDFSYHPFYYDSWYWGYNWWYDWNWYYGWHDPFYYGWYRPYYSWYWHTPYYYNWWYDWNWYAPRYYYGYNYHQTPNIRYGHRERPSTLTTNVYRDSRRTINTQSVTQNRTTTITQERRVAPNTQDRPMYRDGRRTYTPSYSTPRMNTRPSYNNSPINHSYERPSMNRSTENSTTIRTERSTTPRTYSPPTKNYNNYSTPHRNTYSTPNRNTYSTPNRSTYSAPSRSSSSYSTPSRSSGSYSSPSRSSGSSSGSGSSSRSGSSSGGRR